MTTAILIVNYKTPWHLNLCLESIFKFTNNFHIILVQNGEDESSTKIEKNFTTRYPHQFTVINNKTNLGFVGGVNSAYIEAMKYERVCLLNSDTIVTVCWLDELNKALDQNPKAVQVSPDSNSFYPEKLQWKVIKKLPLGLNKLIKYQEKFNPPKSTDNHGFAPIKYFWQFPGGFCNLFKTEPLKKRGFINDPNIVHGYWDDFDLAYYLSQFGELGSTNKSYVFHFINVSFNKISEDKKGMKNRLMLLNGLYVMDKWRERLKQDIAKLDRDTLLHSTDSYVVQMVLEYFGMVNVDPKIVDYIRSIPAKEIGEKFLR